MCRDCVRVRKRRRRQIDDKKTRIKLLERVGERRGRKGRPPRCPSASPPFGPNESETLSSFACPSSSSLSPSHQRPHSHSFFSQRTMTASSTCRLLGPIIHPQNSKGQYNSKKAATPIAGSLLFDSRQPRCNQLHFSALRSSEIIPFQPQSWLLLWAHLRILVSDADEPRVHARPVVLQRDSLHC